MRPSIQILSILTIAVALACSDRSSDPAAPSTADGLQLSADASADNGVVHGVSVGGPDICFALGQHPGCDGNLSFIALEKADGSVTGQYEDASPGGGNSIHADITCLEINQVTLPLGTFNQAWVGGVLTSPSSLAGHPFVTRVRDRGTSAIDLSDVLSYTEIDPQNEGLSANCHDKPPLGLSRIPQGQVRIW